MSVEALKLTTYFGERARTDGRFVADEFSEIYARHELRTSLVMRGFEGFGATQHLRTARLLTLSEDLPLVAVAVDRADRVERVARDVERVPFQGLVTLERARMLEGAGDPDPLARHGAEEVKLTIYVGRYERIDGRPAYEVLVGLLHDQGVAGATVLLGVDGTLHGERRRARMFSRNAGVPLMIIAVGARASIERAIPLARERLERPVMTLERVSVCKRDGRRIGEPAAPPPAPSGGLGVWQKLMVYSGEQTHLDGEPLHQRLVRLLRREGAPGVTCLRGIWGYHGDHAPHGDSFWQLRRRVPVLTVIIDRPERAGRWFELVDRITTRTGLVTSELVPAYRASIGGGEPYGGLALAGRPAPPPRG